MSKWKFVCQLDDIPQLGTRVVKREKGSDIAIFRTSNDEIYALHDKCPHKGGPLSQGIIHGLTVTCPLHSWNIQLKDGKAISPDIGSCSSLSVKLEGGLIFLEI
ncbi:MAG: hypothetical protein RLZZ410_894 [Pseudomonadota bacterium]|jgi:nitrite reductase (NADH) small subunit